MPRSDDDLIHNQEEYKQFWTQRWRRIWTYSSQSKVKRFRVVMKKHGFLKKMQRLRIFDQGFGLGLMLFCFPRGCFLAGYELAESTIIAAQAAARKKGFAETDFRVFQPGLPFPEQWRNSFDLIISSHVLEHIAEPRPALGELLELIRPGGYACILVPINESPGEDLNHFSCFTESSLGTMLTDYKMEIIYSESVDRLYRLLKPLSLARQRKDTIVLKAISKVVNLISSPLPSWCLFFLDRLLGKFSIPPTQCIFLARKPLS